MSGREKRPLTLSLSKGVSGLPKCPLKWFHALTMSGPAAAK